MLGMTEMRNNFISLKLNSKDNIANLLEPYKSV